MLQEILIAIGVGVVIAIVSNVVSHYLAIEREKHRQEQDCDDDDPVQSAQ